MSNNPFSQENLDKLVGADERKNPPSNTDSSDVRKHPSLSDENDISSHPALTNNFEDLSRLGDPSETPSQSPPQESEIPSVELPGLTPPVSFSFEKPNFASSSEVQPQGIQPPSTLSPDITHSSGTSKPDAQQQMQGTDALLMELFQNILQNAPLSQAFCDQLVQMLCENATFMTSLRGKILEQILNTKMG